MTELEIEPYSFIWIFLASKKNGDVSSICRSLWLLSCFILYFPPLDVRYELGPLWLDFWPGCDTRGQCFINYVVFYLHTVSIQWCSFALNLAYRRSIKYLSNISIYKKWLLSFTNDLNIWNYPQGSHGTSIWVHSSENCAETRASHCYGLCCSHGFQCKIMIHVYNGVWKFETTSEKVYFAF